MCDTVALPIASVARPWWQRAVLYQVYVRSFADSDEDGVGDLRGIADRLDYLEWIGVDAVWLSPVTVSPDKDWGYDVADYRDVQPVFGTLEDLDELVAKARERACLFDAVVDAAEHHVLDENLAPAQLEVAHALREDVGQRVAQVHRHQLAAQLVGRRVQREREPDRLGHLVDETA